MKSFKQEHSAINLNLTLVTSRFVVSFVIVVFFLIAHISLPVAAAAADVSTAGQPENDLAPFRFRNLRQDMPLLRGSVSASKGESPLLMGEVHKMTAGTELKLIMPDGMFLNTQVSQKGDEVMMKIAADIKDGGRVILPAGWYVRGLVTEVKSRRRGGRAGYINVEFDKLVSPNGDYELDFNAQFSSKDNKLMAASKILVTDTAYMGIGAAAGALLSVQTTGIATAIATDGISVGVGGGIGAAIGLFAALKRKGSIGNFLPGDVLTLETDQPISLPGFDPAMLLSAAVTPRLEGLDLVVRDYHFRKTPWKDKKARLLELDLDVANNTKQRFHFFDLQVVSDHHQRYSPTPFGGVINRSIRPNHTGSGRVMFTVGSKKRKYFLVFLSRRTGQELTRVPIN